MPDRTLDRLRTEAGCALLAALAPENEQGLQFSELDASTPVLACQTVWRGANEAWVALTVDTLVEGRAGWGGRAVVGLADSADGWSPSRVRFDLDYVNAEVGPRPESQTFDDTVYGGHRLSIVPELDTPRTASPRDQVAAQDSVADVLGRFWWGVDCTATGLVLAVCTPDASIDLGWSDGRGGSRDLVYSIRRAGWLVPKQHHLCVLRSVEDADQESPPARRAAFEVVTPDGLGGDDRVLSYQATGYLSTLRFVDGRWLIDEIHPTGSVARRLTRSSIYIEECEEALR